MLWRIFDSTRLYPAADLCQSALYLCLEGGFLRATCTAAAAFNHAVTSHGNHITNLTLAVGNAAQTVGTTKHTVLAIVVLGGLFAALGIILIVAAALALAITALHTGN